MIIFDMAGTTIDEKNLVYKCIQQALEINKFNTNLDTVLKYCAGKEKLDAIRSVITAIHPETVSYDLIFSVFDTFKQLLNEAYETNSISLYSSAVTLIEYLRNENIKIVFNTGYDNSIAKKILCKVDFLPGEQIDLLVTADMVPHPRPAPDMINYALSMFGISAKECIKIGDSVIDIEEGKNAKVRCSIGITTGAHTREMLLKADPFIVLDDLLELIPIIQNLNIEAEE